jgi:formate-dependent nitrite reductase cytochrome c552 subunit
MVADEFVHTTHAGAEIDCLTCHMQIGEDDIGPEGKIRTAHDFAVKASACVDCHAEAIHGGNQIVSLRAEVRDLEELLPTGIVEEVEGLRVEVVDLEKVAAGKLWAGGTVGALVGLAVGAAAAWLWRRRDQ